MNSNRSLNSTLEVLPRPLFGRYVLVPMDPWKTDSILGPMYGAKMVYVPAPMNAAESKDLSNRVELKNKERNVDESMKDRSNFAVQQQPLVRSGRIQPHPYPFDKHPAHAAREKWLQDYHDGKINYQKPANATYGTNAYITTSQRPWSHPRSKTISLPVTQAPQPQYFIPPRKNSDCPLNRHRPITPPRSTNPERSQAGIGGLSPFAEPFRPTQ